MQAARAATLENPIVQFPADIKHFMNNSILNSISPMFRHGYLGSDFGVPVSTEAYRFCLTFEPEAATVSDVNRKEKNIVSFVLVLVPAGYCYCFCKLSLLLNLLSLLFVGCDVAQLLLCCFFVVSLLFRCQKSNFFLFIFWFFFEKGAQVQSHACQGRVSGKHTEDGNAAQVREPQSLPSLGNAQDHGQDL